MLFTFYFDDFISNFPNINVIIVTQVLLNNLRSMEGLMMV